MAKSDAAITGRGLYLGGLSSEPKLIEGTLEMNYTAIYVIPESSFRGPLRRAVVPWVNVVSVSMEPSQLAQSKIPAVLMFGLLGFAARGKVDEVVITLNLTDGTHVYYAASARFHDFRAGATGFFRAIDRPIVDAAVAAAVAPVPVSLADELTKLAKLRDDGVLTDEEFATQKARLLEQR